MASMRTDCNIRGTSKGLYKQIIMKSVLLCLMEVFVAKRKCEMGSSAVRS